MTHLHIFYVLNMSEIHTLYYKRAKKAKNMEIK
jgi:hypothetical protein